MNGPITYSMQEAALRLGVGRTALFKKLRELAVLNGDNLPAARFTRAGYFCVSVGTYLDQFQRQRPYSRPVVTEKGLIWLWTEVYGHPLGSPSPASESADKRTA